MTNRLLDSPKTFTYNPDTAEAVFSEAGRYRLGFFLAVDSAKEAQCALIIMVNGRMLPGGIFYAALKKAVRIGRRASKRFFMRKTR